MVLGVHAKKRDDDNGGGASALEAKLAPTILPRKRGVIGSSSDGSLLSRDHRRKGRMSFVGNFAFAAALFWALIQVFDPLSSPTTSSSSSSNPSRKQTISPVTVSSNGGNTGFGRERIRTLLEKSGIMKVLTKEQFNSLPKWEHVRVSVKGQAPNGMKQFYGRHCNASTLTHLVAALMYLRSLDPFLLIFIMLVNAFAVYIYVRHSRWFNCTATMSLSLERKIVQPFARACQKTSVPSPWLVSLTREPTFWMRKCARTCRYCRPRRPKIYGKCRGANTAWPSTNTITRHRIWKTTLKKMCCPS